MDYRKRLDGIKGRFEYYKDQWSHHSDGPIPHTLGNDVSDLFVMVEQLLSEKEHAKVRECSQRQLTPHERELALSLFHEWASKQAPNTTPGEYVGAYKAICDGLRRC